MRSHRKGVYRENKPGPKIAMCESNKQGIVKKDDYKEAWEEKAMNSE